MTGKTGMTKMINFNLIGLGVVGSAVYENYNGIGTVTVFDESTELFDENTFRKYLQSFTDDSITMICVNTPEMDDGSQNANALQNILSTLQKNKYSGIVVIKSTVLYSNINQYNSLRIVMYPEFLNARTAAMDLRQQYYHVLGGSILDTKIVEEFITNNFIFDFRDEDLIFEHVTIKEAIDFKYTRNIHLAMNTLFWEMIEDISGNSLKMSNMLKNIPVPENSNISQDGYRGYGQSLALEENTYSACLDKDLSAKLKETNHPLLEAFNKYNKQLLSMYSSLNVIQKYFSRNK